MKCRPVVVINCAVIGFEADVVTTYLLWWAERLTFSMYIVL